VAITALTTSAPTLGWALRTFKRNLDSVVEHARTLRRHGKPVIEDPCYGKNCSGFVDLECFASTRQGPEHLNKTARRARGLDSETLLECN